MRTLFTLSFSLLFVITAFAQDFPTDRSGKIIYTDVVEVNGDKKELYNKALSWFSRAFRSSNDVLQLKDPEQGKLIGRFHVVPASSRLGNVSALITILIKDGKYKYEITDLTYLGTSEFKSWRLEEDPSAFKVGMLKSAQRSIKEGTHESITNTVKDLIVSMRQESEFDF